MQRESSSLQTLALYSKAKVLVAPSLVCNLLNSYVHNQHVLR